MKEKKKEERRENIKRGGEDWLEGGRPDILTFVLLQSTLHHIRMIDSIEDRRARTKSGRARRDGKREPRRSTGTSPFLFL